MDMVILDDDSIDIIISHIDMGYLVTLIRRAPPSLSSVMKMSAMTGTANVAGHCSGTHRSARHVIKQLVNPCFLSNRQPMTWRAMAISPYHCSTHRCPVMVSAAAFTTTPECRATRQGHSQGFRISGLGLLGFPCCFRVV